MTGEELDALRELIRMAWYRDITLSVDEFMSRMNQIDELLALARDGLNWWRIMDSIKAHGEVDPQYARAWELVIAMRGAARADDGATGGDGDIQEDYESQR